MSPYKSQDVQDDEDDTPKLDGFAMHLMAQCRWPHPHLDRGHAPGPATLIGGAAVAWPVAACAPT